MSWFVVPRKANGSGGPGPYAAILGTASAPQPASIVDLPALRASQVAAVYRDLRHSLEARSNQPGASNFYYGEMQMRRYSEDAGFMERAILRAYWFVSGYGLRGLRALACLGALALGAAWVMVPGGFADHHTPFSRALLFSTRAVIPGLGNTEALSDAGKWIEIGLHVTGPVLLALAVLALRARVKR
jgi:hypothetical protein